jgi:hypothetical protein
LRACLQGRLIGLLLHPKVRLFLGNVQLFSAEFFI